MKSKLLALIELDTVPEDEKFQIINRANCLYKVDEDRVENFVIAIDKIHDENEY